MCGIIGCFGAGEVIGDIYRALLIVQHRGQDSAGIITYNGNFNLKKGNGLVSEVFKEKNIKRLRGNIGLGHTRYPTVGRGNASDAQPFYVNSPYGIAMVHNGNVTNYDEIKKELMEENFRHVNSQCDAEAILNVFADELLKQHVKEPKPEHIFAAVKNVFKRVSGAYSVIALIANKGLVAFRDVHGIKPIVFGERTNKEKKEKEYMFASESCVLDMLGYSFIRDIAPGEVIYVDADKKPHSKKLAEEKHTPCIFEYVYFARPDSLIDKISVYKTRLRLGKALAEEWKKTGLKADVVIPVPDSARVAAIPFSYHVGIKYSEGLIKNRYIGRTFIMPSHEKRKSSVREKLSPIRLEIENKNIVVIDDSIVRGTTSKQIIQLLRDSGAKKVFFLSTSPPLRFPCVYGIDMSTKGEFIAKNYSIGEIEKQIGADRLIYQSIENLVKACQKGNPEIKEFCTACFTGKYPTKVSKRMFEKIEEERIKAKQTYENG